MLTEKQLARAEENRKKALAIRKLKALQQQHHNEPKKNDSASNPPLLSSVNPPQNYSPNPSIYPTSTPAQLETDFVNTSNCPQQCKSKNSPPILCGPPIEIKFELVSRTRFKAGTNGFCAEAVKIFKEMGTAVYDPNTKEWNFCLSSYATLVNRLRNFTQFKLGLLPKPIVSTFVKKNYSQCTGSLWTGVADETMLSHLDPFLRDSLLPYQKKGVIKSIGKFNGRVLLADDMGLGKTIQAIAIATYYRSEFPVLIICPSSVRYDWKDAVLKWNPNTVTENQIQLLNTKKEPLSDDALFYIISYDMVGRKTDQLRKFHFQIVICDESHNLKNGKAERTKAVVPIVSRAGRRILLSGTPALSRPQELYTQIQTICPKLFSTFMEYGLRYCDGKMTLYGWNFLGAGYLGELQLLLEERVMIRRLKKDVLCDLPKKERVQVMIEAANVDSFESIALKDILSTGKELFDTNNNLEKHALIAQLFRKSAEVKLPGVLEYIAQFVKERGEKLLVFAHHKIIMEGICHLLDKMKVSHVRIDGSCPSAERHSLCNKFRADEDCKVCILSILIAPGLTLTCASTAIFTELFWNPGALLQAEDRIHRIGQEHTCKIVYILCKGTADDHIWPLLSRKLNVLSDVGLNEKENDLSNIKSVEQAQRTFIFSRSKHEKGSSKEGNKLLHVNEEFIMDDFFEEWKAEQLRHSELNEALKEGKKSNSKGCKKSTDPTPPPKKLRLCDIANIYSENSQDNDFAWDF